MPEQTQHGKELLRRRFEWLSHFSDDELRELSLCEEGNPLSRSDEYFDISHPERGIIRGGEMEAVPNGSCYVAKSTLSERTWEHLTTAYSGGTQLRM